jgi:hypothetical protein
LVAALVTLVLGAGAGFGAQRYLEPDRLVDVSLGDFSLRVPRSMAGVVVQSTWRPPGATSDQPAIRVSKDDGWNTPGQQTPGVFVGAMPNPGDLQKVLPSADQYKCATDGGISEGERDGLKTLDRLSFGCAGGSTMLQRVTLTPSGSALLVQVQVPGSDRALATQVADLVSYLVPANR